MAAPAGLAGLRLNQFVDSDRFKRLDLYDAYARNTQYNARRYDWDGRMRAAVGEVDIDPGWYVPLKHRRPSATVELGKLITKRLTAMAVGEEQWPEINCDGDVDAEDYVKTLAEVGNVQGKLQEACERGTACGTAVVSFAYIDGKPRVSVHRAKHIWVLQWKDRDEYTIASALKVYRYKVWGFREGKPVELQYYFARHWDENSETVWDPIPDEKARDGTWSSSVPSVTVIHGYGEAPIYWTQNLPDSETEDGASCFDGMLDTFDRLNELLSATLKGTVANVDPTLVIHDDPGNNTGSIRKGSENAIYSKEGAEYLEIEGKSVQTALELVGKITQYELDVAGVVLGDPHKMGTSAQSAAAMRMLYLPMVTTCDILRTQYGNRLLVPLLVGMLKAARKIEGQQPGEVKTTSDGRRVQEKPTVILPDKVVTERKPGAAPPRIDPENPEPPPRPEPGEVTTKTEKRKPGTSENITLKWPPYFRPTATDINQMTDAVTKAKGQVISDETAVKFMASTYGVKDVNQELVDIEVGKAVNAAMYPGPDMMLPPGMSGAKGGKEGQDNEEEE